MTGYRIYLVGGERRELSADRCRQAGADYVFERENPSGEWRTVHRVAVDDVAQLHDGVRLNRESHESHEAHVPG